MMNGDCFKWTQANIIVQNLTTQPSKGIALDTLPQARARTFLPTGEGQRGGGKRSRKDIIEMKKNNLLASMAGKALALATAMMISMAFTSCSDDNDTAPAAQTKPSVNTVTLDGVTCAVTTTELPFLQKGTSILEIFSF